MFHVVSPCVHPSVTFCFLNILKSHCWNFIKPCKHIYIYKTTPTTALIEQFNTLPIQYRHIEHMLKEFGLKKLTK